MAVSDTNWPRWLYVAMTLAIGALTWVSVHYATGEEPWNLASFWTLHYPLLIAIAAALGAYIERVPFLWGLLIGLGECIGALFMLYDQAIILPITVGSFLILSIPLSVASWVGSKARRMLRGRVVREPQ